MAIEKFNPSLGTAAARHRFVIGWHPAAVDDAPVNAGAGQFQPDPDAPAH